MSRSACGITSMPRGSSSRLNSRSLPALLEARTRREIIAAVARSLVAGHELTGTQARKRVGRNAGGDGDAAGPTGIPPFLPIIRNRERDDIALQRALRERGSREQRRDRQ